MLNTKSLKYQISQDDDYNKNNLKKKFQNENLSINKFNNINDDTILEYKEVDIEPKNKQLENIIIEANHKLRYNPNDSFKYFNNHNDVLINNENNENNENNKNNNNNENNKNNDNNDINVTEPKDRSEWNDQTNSYLLYENGNLECTITNDNILNNILGISNENIKKYIFIIGFNKEENTNEFNFINTIFTNNIDSMIKVQNFIYETINNFDNLDKSDNYDNKEVLIFFYYQLIIWLFKNIIIYEKTNDIAKICKFFSCLTYRFSSLILKNIIRIEDINNTNAEIATKLVNSKNNLLKKMDSLDNLLKKSIMSSSVTDESTNNQFDSNQSDSELTESELTEFQKSNNKFNIQNKKNSDSNNLLKKYNIKDKNGFKVKNLNDLFSEEINDNSSDNGYIELNINNEIYDTINEDENNDDNNFKIIKNIDDTSNIINQISGSNNKSYNINSALVNGKSYKININK